MCLWPRACAPPDAQGFVKTMEMSIARRLLLIVVVTWTVQVTAPKSYAASYQSAGGLIGDLQHYTVGENQSLVELARKFGLGFNAIVDANPGVDPLVPSAGTLLVIPTAWILPDVPSFPGIVINIAEFRLYQFPVQPSGTVNTFPLGIGDEGRDTPVGNYKVIQKIVKPAWHVPRSIRSESRELPKVVPPGPRNPLGSHALRLSLQAILIHGTNRPWGIGRRSSHGCLRLYPEDIVVLFGLVGNGTRVVIVNQPIKAVAVGERVFVEAHRYEPEESSISLAMHLLAEKNLLGKTDFAKLIRAVEEMKGIPVDITLSRSPVPNNSPFPPPPIK